MLDEEELNQFIKQNGDSLLRMSYLYLKDLQLAEDALQDTYIKVLKNINTYKGNSNIKTWITRILINTCKNYLRTAYFKRIIFGIPDGVNLDYDLEQRFINNELEKQLIKEICNLKKEYKEVILLFYYQNFKISEIAQILKISESLVKSRLFRAKNKLNKNLKEVYFDE